MAHDLAPRVRLDLPEPDALALYRWLTDERPHWMRDRWPLPFPTNAMTRLHCALQERTVRNKL